MKGVLPSTIMVRAGIFLGATLLAAGTLLAAPLEGRFRLVEQTLGAGALDYARPDAPLRIEFAREGPRLTGKIWTQGGAVAWPAFASHESLLPVEVQEQREDVRAGSVRVRYRVRPSAEDDTLLEVVEEYQLSDDGKTLLGTLTLFSRGSPLVWHRRFEREP